MKSTTLGRTSVRVTELGFGGAPIGNLFAEVPDEQAHAAVDAAWTAGVRYFDTAPHYGLGISERRLGAALRGRPRAEYAISTKVGRLLVANPDAGRPGSDLVSGGFAVPDTLTRVFDYSRDGVMRSLEASLDRLGLDRIDIALIHDPDDHMDAALAEAVPALVDLRDQGVIGAIGAGMNTVGPLTRFATETDVDVIMAAGRWTLLDRTAGPLLDTCAARGISVLSAAPFNSGLLASDQPTEGTFNYVPASAELLASARRYAQLARSHGATLPQLALQFPLRHPAVASVVAGMVTPEQSAADAAWLATPVPEPLWDSVAAS